MVNPPRRAPITFVTALQDTPSFEYFNVLHAGNYYLWTYTPFKPSVELMLRDSDLSIAGAEIDYVVDNYSEGITTKRFKDIIFDFNNPPEYWTLNLKGSEALRIPDSGIYPQLYGRLYKIDYDLLVDDYYQQVSGSVVDGVYVSAIDSKVPNAMFNEIKVKAAYWAALAYQLFTDFSIVSTIYTECQGDVSCEKILLEKFFTYCKLNKVVDYAFPCSIDILLKFLLNPALVKSQVDEYI